MRSWELLRYGNATKTNERRSLAYDAHDIARRRAAKSDLQYPPVLFNGLQARAVARGFSLAVMESKYIIYACAIMPDHTHIVAGPHDYGSVKMVGHLKGRATQQLRAEGLHPFENHAKQDGTLPPIWARRGWSVFLNSRDEVRRAIGYTNENPVREGLKQQSWSIVQPYVI